MTISSAAPEPEPDNVISLRERYLGPKSLGKQFQQAVEHEQTIERDFRPYEVLRDMLLPDPPRTNLCNALVNLGYQVEEEILQHRFDPTYQSKVISIRAPGAQAALYLVHMPDRLLKARVTEYQGAVLYVGQVFPPASEVRILSTGLPDVAGTYLQIMDGWRNQQEGFDAQFVSWNRIQELEEDGFPPDRVPKDLRVTVKVAVAGGGDEKPPSIDEHVEEIADVLADEALASPGGSEAFLAALVVQLSPSIPAAWAAQLTDVHKGDPRAQATRLVRWAIRQGQPPQKLGHQLIGILMAELSESVSAERSTELWELIGSCRLLPPDEIAKHEAGG